jgi:hypothetical protein
MSGSKKHYPLDLREFRPDIAADLINRKLLYWLSDDKTRAELFSLITEQHGGWLDFPSRDASPRHCDCDGVDRPLPEVNPKHVNVRLVTDRTRIKEVLLNADGRYSSRVYAELGGGSFMLALDPNATNAHALQRQAYRDSFPHELKVLKDLAFSACQSAAVLGFRAPAFDLARFAEQAALRCVQMLMGYALKDYRLLETGLGAAYRALVYQVMERHFVSNPVLIPNARTEMARLLARTSELIDAYAAEDEDALKGTRYPERPHDLEPVLKNLGTLPGNLNGEQRATIALGAAIGTVGNVQAAVCIVMKALFAGTEDTDPHRNNAARQRLDELRRRAQGEHPDWPTACFDEWKALLVAPLRENPPIPYLPRLEVDKDGKKVRELLLALGGGTAGQTNVEGDDPLVWGLAKDAPHWCLGQALAWPLIVEIVRHVLALPSLAQGLDLETGKAKGLEKRNGFACKSYPFEHRRDRRRAQTSLNIAMRVKAPVKDNADRVRETIRAGAPRIERALRASRHVHFAWFEMIEADTVLVLHTVYDGPFGAYLQHFALDAGDLFDVLFQYIEDPPPMPVERFPNEFVAHLLRYDRGPVNGYLFSAYPSREVAQIIRNERRG